MQVLHGEALSPVSQAVYKLVALVLYRRSHFITLVRTPGDALGAFEVGKPGAAKPSMYQLVDDDRVTDITSLASAQDRICSEGWRPHAVVYEQARITLACSIQA